MLATANNSFCADIYRTLAQGNLFISPISIETALAMTMAGADGETLKEMKSALRLEFPEDQIDAEFEKIISVINNGDKGYALRIANAIFPSKDLNCKEEWVKRILKYKAGVRCCDFKNNPDGERQAINAWVEEQTDNKITNLIPPGAIDASTINVIVNAIYFKGDWQTKFEKHLTDERVFFQSNGEKTNAMMMKRTDTMILCEEEKFNSVYLPYIGNEVGMIVILPNTPGTLLDVETHLNSERLNDLVQKMCQGYGEGVSHPNVNLALPRFKVEVNYELSSSLKDMGMKKTFADADFSRMSDQKSHISAVFHKAFIEVNEEGTEAAAATGVVMVGCCYLPPRQVYFIANHPFLFAIVHRPTKTILFWGKLEKP